jgi:hypothetical protein
MNIDIAADIFLFTAYNRNLFIDLPFQTPSLKRACSVLSKLCMPKIYIDEQSQPTM